MNYEPAPVPTDPKQLAEYLTRELRRFGALMRDESQKVLYLTLPANQGSLTAGISANWKHASGNVVRISTSATVTLTGIAYKVPNRLTTYVNVGHGVLYLKSEGTESSESYRFLLSNDLNLSANGAATCWYDSYSSRHRVIWHT